MRNEVSKNRLSGSKVLITKLDLLDQKFTIF